MKKINPGERYRRLSDGPNIHRDEVILIIEKDEYIKRYDKSKKCRSHLAPPAHEASAWESLYGPSYIIYYRSLERDEVLIWALMDAKQLEKFWQNYVCEKHILGD